MFFLKHVVPLVIISVFIGYVVARVGIPALDNREAASGGETNVANISARPEPEPASAEQNNILRRVREAVDQSSDAVTPDKQDRYTSDVNSEIEAAVEVWSAADNLPDSTDASQSSTEPQQEVREQVAAESEVPAETSIVTATEPAPSSEERVAAVEAVTTEPPAETTSDAEEPATENVSIALADPATEAADSALAAEVAAELTAEIGEQAPTELPGTSATMSLEDVIGARWTLGNEPAAPHLPSFITSCTQKGESFECWSGEYSTRAGNKAKTKSIVRNADASGFTIRYRNMVTDPKTKRSKWDADVKQLNCTAQAQNRVRCIDESNGQEIIYTRVTGEQFPSRFTLSSLASTKWYSGSQPAEYLPSGTTQCESEASALVCWSTARTVQTDQGTNSVKTKSEIRKTGDGTFSVTYRDLVTTAGGQGSWEQDSHEARCRVMGFERIVCEDHNGSRSYAKAAFKL